MTVGDLLIGNANKFPDKVAVIYHSAPVRHDHFCDEATKFCGERPAGFKKPKPVDFWTDPPKSPQGKILKKTIREFYKKLQTNP